MHQANHALGHARSTLNVALYKLHACDCCEYLSTFLSDNCEVKMHKNDISDDI